MGGGPAGLAAGYELAKNTIDTMILEADSQVGGISKTINYKNYYFDLGGHRFFTKSDEVSRLWNEILGDDFRRTPRLSRIYYKNKFFNYPLTAINAFFRLGIIETITVLLSYLKSKIKPLKNEYTFEQWITNRFGRKLYLTFFKTYTEKVWGIPCSSIQAEWAAQRIKGLSLKTAIVNALFKSKSKKVKTLIDEFYYPTYGPGMMYTEMKSRIEKMNGTVSLNTKVTKIFHENFIVKGIECVVNDGKSYINDASNFISSIPITEVIDILSPAPERSILEAARSLEYRSLITVDIIVNKKEIFPDNWIYIHSPEVRLGRIQNFKNWSRKMVEDANKTTLGLEYFCDEDDNLWNMDDKEIFELAASEVEKIKICNKSEIEDFAIIKVPKAYPVYNTNYKKHLNVIENYLRKFKNLQLIGRYGLFKYNNMDHSILSGIMASKNVMLDEYLFDTWCVNTDEDYHEEELKSEGVVI